MKINPDPPLLFSHQQGCFPATTPPAQGCSDSAAPGKVRSSELGWRGQRGDSDGAPPETQDFLSLPLWMHQGDGKAVFIFE